jgi:hypothetical protein
MACKTREGERILPRVTETAAEDLAKRAADQQALINSLLTGMQLQGQATQRQGAADTGAAQHPVGLHALQDVLKGEQQSHVGDPQRPAAAGQLGQTLTQQGLTKELNVGLLQRAQEGQPLDMAALQKALEAALQQQAGQQLQPGLAGVGGTKKA